MSRRRPVLPTLLAGVLLFPVGALLTGCGQETATESAASTGTASATASATAPSTAAETSAPAASSSAPASGSSSAAPSFPGDTRPDTAEPAGADGLTVTSVRSGRHDGFDRVVFELAGEGTPGWDVRYVDSATAEGTGAPIGLAGPAYLRVTMTGTTYPFESGADEVARGSVGSAGAVVTGAFYDGTFEGQSLAYIGTGAEVPFRVYALSAPARVVVEVAAD
jgi:hypothetical protein